jgi:cation diffusion facilitator CzcD-associated flavoprotein CzcO
MPPTPKLSQGEAKALAARVGFLALPDVTELSAGASEELSYHPGTLDLSGLSSLTLQEAHNLGLHRDWLFLDGLTSLDADCARRLARHHGGLSLRGLTSLECHIASLLAATTGDLRLDGLRDLPPDVASALASLRGRLSLDGLQSPSVETLLAIAPHAGGLSLGGIDSLDASQADALASYRGRLWLDGLKNLPRDVAEILGRHEGGLSLEGLGNDVGSDVLACLRATDRERLGARHRAANAVDSSPVRFVTRSRQAESLGVAIIGGGFAGIAMAIRLREAGRTDFAILEKASALGGTWRDNTYPGCACDIPSRLYSYSFAPEGDWSRRYAPQSEILTYIDNVAGRHDVHRFTRFETAVETITWDESSRLWRLTASDGRRFTARAVVSAVGGIHIPHVPHLTGLDDFAGPAFHTARWQHDVDLAGKHVAVIGTGASAIQVIPEIASNVARLHVFQRSAPWVLPRGDRPITPFGRWMDEHVPGLRMLRRQMIYWMNEARAIPFTQNPRLVGHPQRKAKAHMKASGAGYRLRLKLEPPYALGCKRVLKSDDYYATLTKENVEVVTESIDHIGRWDITTQDGIVRPVDAIVLATGFKPFNLTDAVDVVGRGGQSLSELWQDGPQAYHGMTVAGFPNLFMIMGPNTALGHNSILVMIEAQVDAIMEYLGWLERGELPAVEVRSEAQAAFNTSMEERFERSVWRSSPLVGTGDKIVPPCNGWYRHASGRNHVIWPGSTSSYLAAVRSIGIAAFRPAEDFVTLPENLPMRRAA